MASHRKQSRSSATRPQPGANRRLSPDLITLNGKVFIPGADPARRFAQAVAVVGDRVLAVGTSGEIAAMADTHTRRIELNGRVVIPGFNDAHVHHTPDPRATRLALTGSEPTWEQVLNSLAAAVKEAPSGTWILGTHGIQVVNDPRATRFELDRIAPNHPVRLNCYFGHGSLINTKPLCVQGQFRRANSRILPSCRRTSSLCPSVICRPPQAS